MSREFVLTLSILALASEIYQPVHAEPVLHRVRRLIDGEVVPGSRPFMAVLAYKVPPSEGPRPYLVFCSAVLVSSQHVLATAHCLDDLVLRDEVKPDLSTQSSLYVVLGLQDNSFGAVNDVQEFLLDRVTTTVEMASQFTLHPVFNNDIAVIRLASPAQLCSTVFPLELPPSDINDDKMAHCEFFGWGVTNEPVLDSDFTQFLRTAPLKLKKRQQCQRFYRGFLDDDHLCADGSAIPCFGDSGSPLICTFKEKQYLVGLNSFRQAGPCALGTPQIYTRVANFLDFISERIGIDQTDSSDSTSDQDY